MGLDIGPQTLAYSAADAAGLAELADQVQSIEQEKRRLLRKMDRSRRASNPDNYREDGTIKRGCSAGENAPGSQGKRGVRSEKIYREAGKTVQGNGNEGICKGISPLFCLIYPANP